MADTPRDLPSSLEKIMVRAAQDTAFGERLLADREQAVEELDIQLTQSDRATLRAVSDQQFRLLIQQMGQMDPEQITALRAMEPIRCTGIRPGPFKGIRPGRAVLTAAVALTVGAGVGGALLLTAGVRPDVEESALQSQPVPDAKPPGDGGVDK